MDAAQKSARVPVESPPGRKIYMDYNATTPLEPAVIQAVTEAMKEAWGNPSSSYVAGRKAKDIINTARVSLAKMIGGKPQDIIFTSGGTESNNLVIQSMVRCFHKEQSLKGLAVDQSSPEEGTRPHFITCTVEHDSIRLPLEHLMEEQVAEVTFVPVSKVTGQAEVEDVLAAVRPTTCLVTIMLANNETGVIMPVSEISRRVKALNQGRAASGLPRVLVHTDAAQALGKRRVDVEDLGVDFLTIVGHKHSPQLVPKGAQHWPDTRTLHPLLHITGKQRNISTVPGLVLCMYEGSVNLPPCTPCCLEVDKSGISGQEPRTPGSGMAPPTIRCALPHRTENTPMIAGLGKAAELVSDNCEAYEAHMRDIRDYLEERLEAEFGKRICLNSRFPGTERLPNTCNFSIQGAQLPGYMVLAQCRTLLASVGASCHSDHEDRPSPVLLSCGIPTNVARNALRLSVGRSTTRAEVDLVVQDLKQAVAQLESQVVS
ncbi:selenocysteine lyase isoform X2 [Meriones unguiculatus]|uniref:selenocysteine lyase isoform X2 n=1 Tax=Meriones unguiculatus TaxID=10047 RepID=UPI00293F6A7F|nr:selenocysteine lyase isoform X2 [Meriones unguiculatus]